MQEPKRPVCILRVLAWHVITRGAHVQVIIAADGRADDEATDCVRGRREKPIEVDLNADLVTVTTRGPPS